MGAGIPRGKSSYLLLVLLQGALAVALVAGGSWLDRVGRSGGPEAPLLAYVAALGHGNLDEALDQLAPEARDESASFVAWQLGNRYTIVESAVRSESLLGRLARSGNTHTRVVVMMEIQEGGGALWRATEELPVESILGRWYLLKPPLK